MSSEPYVFVGVDPGVTGAIAAFMPRRGNRTQVWDLEPDEKGALSLHKLKVTIESLRRWTEAWESDTQVYIEGQSSRPLQGLSSTFKHGMTYGSLLYAFLRFPVTIVQARTWKRHFELGQNKHHSLELARGMKLLPAEDLKLVKHHNRAEALLMAVYAAYRASL